jgi:glutamate:Na+ symporter, ESS family
VVAPLAVAGWGLPTWTVFCLAFVLVAGGAGLFLARWGRNTEASSAHP